MIARVPSDYWEDLRFPATAINPPGAASDPDVESSSGTFLFDGGKTELIYLVAQLPHAWREESTLRPHVHWQKTTSASGNVLWRFSYKWAPINAVMDAAYTDVDASSTVAGTPDTDTADKHLITAFGDLTATDKQISDMLLIKLSRIGGSDTYGADARLLEFDIHYRRTADTPGSALEFTKG